MKKTIQVIWMLLLAAVGCAFSIDAFASAEIKPQWVLKGEDQLNRLRKTDTYEFKVFHTFDPDLTKLRDTRFRPLLKYVGETYGVNPLALQIDSIPAFDGNRTTYRVMLEQGAKTAVYAQLVDEYQSFEDYVDNEYGFEFYQLYAVTPLTNDPAFDDYEIERTDNLTAGLLSIIPSAGQFYKGANARAWTVLGGEVLFGAGAIIYQFKKVAADANVANGIPNVDSWKSKSVSYQGARNFCFGAMAGIYAYSIIDAIFAKGTSRLKVYESKEQNFNFGPTQNGIGLTYNF